MNRIIPLIGVLILLATVGMAQADLLVNGGAETGMTGWTHDPQVSSTTHENPASPGDVHPFAGSRFFTYEDTSGSAASMSQTGTDGLDLSGLLLSGEFTTETHYADPDDYAEAWIRVRDSGGAVIGSAYTGELLPTSNLAWTPFFLQCPVPTGAASWEVQIKGTREYGSYITVFVDDLELKAVPEPATIALLAVGGLALLRRRLAA